MTGADQVRVEALGVDVVHEPHIVRCAAALRGFLVRVSQTSCVFQLHGRSMHIRRAATVCSAIRGSTASSAATTSGASANPVSRPVGPDNLFLSNKH